MSAELVVLREQDQSDYMPVMSIEQAVYRRKMLVDYTRALMVEGQDFGTIPGAGNKKVLLKPGAEKLATIFGLTPQFEIVQQVERWEPDENGELLFSYVYRCSLYRGDRLLANADGSCNSREKKYRYRKGERTCPNCGQATIIKGKSEYGGGWLCYAKKGGCGAKFADGAEAIEKQDTGQMINPDVPDLINTLQKMAQKRALIAATLIGVNASEFFTQDMEDFAPPPHVDTSTGEIQDAAPTDPEPDPAEGERLQAERKAAIKQTREEFKARADRLGYEGDGADLARQLSGKDKPTGADLSAALQLPVPEWTDAIDAVNEQRRVLTAIVEQAAPALDVETTIVPLDDKASKQTVGAMSR